VTSICRALEKTFTYLLTYLLTTAFAKQINISRTKFHKYNICFNSNSQTITAINISGLHLMLLHMITYR